MAKLDPPLMSLQRRARTLLRLLKGAPPRRAPKGHVHLGGLTAALEIGSLDGVFKGAAKGWARRPGTPERPVSVDFYVDGRFLGRTQADRFRPDLADPPSERGMHGFSYALPVSVLAGTELRAFASASGVELAGSPRLLAAAPAVAPAPRAARELLKLDFVAPRALTLGEQRAHYGRRFEVLADVDPRYPSGLWPISRSMGYVDGRIGGRSAIGGASRFFRLFDTAAEHFSATPYGMPIGYPTLAALCSPPRVGAAPTRLTELIVEAKGYANAEHLTATDYAGIGLDYLHARRLPIDLLGDALLQRLRDPTQLLPALRHLSALRQATASDEALMTAAEALGIPAALRGDANPEVNTAAEPGVLIVSADYGDTGLGVNVSRTLQAMQLLGVDHQHVSLKTDALISERPTPGRLFDTVLLHAQPTDTVEIISRLPAEQMAQRLIGFFMWETEVAPPVFDLGLHLVDEVWTGSRFSADALSTGASPTKVHVIGHAVAPDPIDAVPDIRDVVGADGGEFLVYTHFDGGSWITRKNPGGVAQAFRRAFPRGDEPCRLLIKTRGGGRDLSDAVRAEWDELQEMIDADARIRLVNKDLDRAAAATLMRSADCYVSLHRAEGFGYGPAEALLAGVPLIVSAYSGSLDFTDGAWLTPCRRRPIRAGEFLTEGAGQVWGEPDLDIAAAHLIEIFRDRPGARARAEAARVRAAAQLSVETLSQRYRARLKSV